MIKSQSASPFNATNESCAPSLWDDFQRRNLVPFEFEKESKVNGAAGKISNQMAGDDRLPVLRFARERLACVFILGRGIRLPLFDCGPAFVGVPLVLHDGIFSEALRERLAVTFVGGEVGGDLFWQVERFRCLFHIYVLSCWYIFFLLSQTVGIVPPSITNSLPVMAEALSDARKATSSATSSGRLGRPKGIPPNMSMSFCRAAT